jgi:hypothetical protein
MKRCGAIELWCIDVSLPLEQRPDAVPVLFHRCVCQLTPGRHHLGARQQRKQTPC